MATYSYARVSTALQADEGESLGVQSRTAAGYAQMQALTIDETFVERGVSGSVPLASRPEGARLLSALRPGDNVIAAKLDRLFRSASDALTTLEDFKRRNIKLHLLDLGGDVVSNGVAKLVFTVLAAVAEAERDRTRERIVDVKADQKRRHRYLGGKRPFGFEVGVDGSLTSVPAEQAAIEQMITLRQSGTSLRKIAEIVSAGGISISHETVGAVLNSRGKNNVARFEPNPTIAA